MKGLLLLIVIFQLSHPVRCQDSLVLAKFDNLRIYLPNPLGPDSLTRQMSVFRHFDVYDERPDPHRLGVVHRTSLGSTNYKQLELTAPVSDVLTDYLNIRFAHPDAPYTALIVLRTLWLGDANHIREDLVKDPGKDNEKSRIRLKAEIYALRDSVYIPVFRFDTTEASDRGTKRNMGEHLAYMLDEIIDSASTLITQRAGRGRTISLGDILSYNQSRRDAPISRDTALVKGVYANFQEFRNNAPSIRDFEVKIERRQRFLYVTEGGQTYYAHTCWGYCDGRRIYIMDDGVLQQVWREGGAYYFVGKAESSGTLAPDPGAMVDAAPPTGGGAVAGLAIGEALAPAFNSSPNKLKRIYAIDMDSGKFY
jgi:hypothetical protein